MNLKILGLVYGYKILGFWNGSKERQKQYSGKMKTRLVSVNMDVIINRINNIIIKKIFFI